MVRDSWRPVRYAVLIFRTADLPALRPRDTMERRDHDVVCDRARPDRASRRHRSHPEPGPSWLTTIVLPSASNLWMLSPHGWRNSALRGSSSGGHRLRPGRASQRHGSGPICESHKAAGNVHEHRLHIEVEIFTNDARRRELMGLVFTAIRSDLRWSMLATIPNP
jgi:hypothetical protein